jgi:hypothetical protein
MALTGSAFAATFGPKGLPAWEAAALSLAREPDGLTPWPFAALTLDDGAGNTAVLQVQTDEMAIGTLEDHLRLPLTPSAAQSILNLRGWLLPTPWLVYQIWRAAPARLEPKGMSPNLGASMAQYAAHSALIDQQLAALGAGGPNDGAFRAGMKKSVVVSNIAQPGKVLIFGWYRPPPAPDVFDDRLPMSAPNRQPIQPRSNVHGGFYVDYSHGIRAVHGTCLLNGRPTSTVDLYQHPTLSHLVSNEGPVRLPRYPAIVPPATPAADLPASILVATTPGLAEQGITVARRGT